jgi:hypothetical protein
MSSLEHGESKPGSTPPEVSPDRIAASLRALSHGFGVQPPENIHVPEATEDNGQAPAVSPGDAPEAAASDTELLSDSQVGQLVAAEQQRLAEVIRNYGSFDKAYDAAAEHVGPLLDLPPPSQCLIRPYREVELHIDPVKGPTEVETGGGIQIDIATLETGDSDGVYTFGVRVPVYELTGEGAVRPVGGRFDDLDEARMVAAQGDDWTNFARQHNLPLRPDLTIVDQEEFEPTIITCPRP